MKKSSSTPSSIDTHRKVSVAIGDIVKIIAKKDYVQVHTVDGKSHLYLTTLQEVEEASLGSLLVRVHRSVMVNRDYVGYVERISLIGIGGEEVKLQQRYAAKFLRMMGIE